MCLYREKSFPSEPFPSNTFRSPQACPSEQSLNQKNADGDDFGST